MPVRLKALIAATVSGALMAAAAAAPAGADPIYCPNGQTAVKSPNGGGWTCVNGGDNSSGAGWHQGTGSKT